jgi:hypothetical protein
MKCASLEFLGLGRKYCQDCLVTDDRDSIPSSKKSFSSLLCPNRLWVFPVFPTGTGHNILENKISLGCEAKLLIAQVQFAHMLGGNTSGGTVPVPVGTLCLLVHAAEYGPWWATGYRP